VAAEFFEGGAHTHRHAFTYPTGVSCLAKACKAPYLRATALMRHRCQRPKALRPRTNSRKRVQCPGHAKTNSTLPERTRRFAFGLSRAAGCHLQIAAICLLHDACRGPGAMTGGDRDPCSTSPPNHLAALIRGHHSALVILAPFALARLAPGPHGLVTMTKFPGVRFLESRWPCPLAFPSLCAGLCHTRRFLEPSPACADRCCAEHDRRGPRGYWFPESAALAGRR